MWQSCHDFRCFERFRAHVVFAQLTASIVLVHKPSAAMEKAGIVVGCAVGGAAIGVGIFCLAPILVPACAGAVLVGGVLTGPGIAGITACGTAGALAGSAGGVQAVSK